MLDRKILRDDPELVKAKLATRGKEFPAIVDRILKRDAEGRRIQVELDDLRRERKELSKEIGKLMQAGDVAQADEKKESVKAVNEKIAAVETRFNALQDERVNLLATLPNLPDDSVPVGGEDARQLVKEHGEQRCLVFKGKDHVELAASLNLIDFAAAGRISGSGFQFYVGLGAELQRALINLMLDVHISEHGYREMRPPFRVKPEAPFSTGQLPKFKEDMYHVFTPLEQVVHDPGGQPDYYLIPTAEVPVCNYYHGCILPPDALPVKLVAYTPCWRVEAGHYGHEARGLRRVHEFDKVELVVLCAPEESDDVLERMTGEAEHILELLELPYRRVLLPTGDMTFASAKTYDLDVYSAVSGEWLEVSSASNTGDFQARRANIRFRRDAKAKPEFVHMLNASGLALPRIVIALLENNQLEDGTVAVPEPLQKYMRGVERLEPPGNPLPFLD